MMGEGDGLGQVFIQAQGAADVSRNGGNFHRMGQPRAQMIAGAVEKDLRFVFQASKRAGMDYAIPIPLVFSAPFGRRLAVLAPAGVGAELGVRGEVLLFELLEFLSRAGHDETSRSTNETLTRQQL